jgi:putative membrane protein
MPHVHHGAVGSSGSVFITLIVVLAVVAYLRGWLYIRSDSEKGISAWLGGSFFAGLVLIWIATASPISALDEQLLTVHMVQHLLLMTLAAPLIWLGEPVRVVLHGLPHRVGQLVVTLFQRTLVQKLWIAITRPTCCLLAATAVLVGWHIPALFGFGMHSKAWHVLEQSSFLATGLLFWWPVIQPWPSVSRQDLSIVLYLFLATLPCDILSGFLVFGDRVVYSMYLSVSQPLGLTALEDQQCAGALMWTCVTVVYLAAGAMLTVRLLRPARSS